jgi:predicted MFS family arabinose efflux permease
LLGPPLEQKVGIARAVILTQGLGVLALVIIPLPANLAVLLPLYVFRAVSMNAGLPLVTSFLMSEVSENERGLASALATPPFGLSYGLAITGGIWTSGLLLNTQQYSLQFELAGILHGSGVALFYLFFRRRKSLIHT